MDIDVEEHIRRVKAEREAAEALERAEAIEDERIRLEADHERDRVRAQALRDAGLDPRNHIDEPPRRRLTGGTGTFESRGEHR